MSTRSLICKELPNGKYRTIYCHFDGYLEHNGCILNDIYDTEEKVDKLLSLGDLSMLDIHTDKDVNRKHDNEKRQVGVCLAYHRDLKEKELITHDYLFNELLVQARNSWSEFIYLFRQDGKWTVAKYKDFKDASIEESDKAEIFTDLNDQIELTVSVHDRYLLTPERAKLLNQLNYKVEDEMIKIIAYFNELKPIDVFSKAYEISAIKAVKTYIDESYDRFTNKEINNMLAQSDLLETISSEGVLSNYKLNDRVRKAAENFLFSSSEQDNEQY